MSNANVVDPNDVVKKLKLRSANWHLKFLGDRGFSQFNPLDGINIYRVEQYIVNLK